MPGTHRWVIKTCSDALKVSLLLLLIAQLKSGRARSQLVHLIRKFSKCILLAGCKQEELLGTGHLAEARWQLRGTCSGWEVELAILEVTFATQLIIVKLLNSLASVKPTFCGFKSQGRRHYRTDCQVHCCCNSLGQRAPRRKTSPATFVF